MAALKLLLLENSINISFVMISTTPDGVLTRAHQYRMELTMHLLNVAGRTVPQTKDYSLFTIARGAIKSRFNHLSDDDLSDENITAVLGLKSVLDLDSHLDFKRLVTDSNLADVSASEKELLIALSTYMNYVDESDMKQSHAWEKLKEVCISVFIETYNDDHTLLADLKDKVIDFFTANNDDEGLFAVSIALLIPINWVFWGRVSNTLYSISNPNLNCKENLKPVYHSFSERCKKTLDITPTRSKAVDLLHEISGAAAGAQADRPFLIKPKQSIVFSPSAKKLFELFFPDSIDDEIKADGPLSPLLKLLFKLQENWQGESPTIADLLGDNPNARWVQLNETYAACLIKLSLKDEGGWLHRRWRNQIIHCAGAILYFLACKSQSKLKKQTAYRPDHSELADAEGIADGFKKYNWTASVLRAVKDNYSYPMDGAELISEMANYRGMRFDMDDASEFDEVDSRVDSTMKKAEWIWADVCPYEKSFSIGDEIEGGVITGVYDYTPCVYLVKLYDHDDENDGNSRRLINFENATAKSVD